MPFTFAHPAAVLPLASRLGKWGIPSALVIGCMVPDFAYFVSLPLSRLESHSLRGLFWFCLPCGLLLFWLWHAFMKRPLAALLPQAIFQRLDEAWLCNKIIWKEQWIYIFCGILFGALTHVGWDAFTHESSPLVAQVAFLRHPVFVVHGFVVTVSKILQHTSSLLGMAVLALWLKHWARATPVRRPARTGLLGGPWVFAVMLGVAVLWGLGTSLHGRGVPSQLLEWRLFVGDAVFAALPVLSGLLLLFCGLFHWKNKNSP